MSSDGVVSIFSPGAFFVVHRNQFWGLSGEKPNPLPAGLLKGSPVSRASVLVRCQQLGVRFCTVFNI